MECSKIKWFKGVGVCDLTPQPPLTIPFTQNGEKALDFRREFTITAWVKVDSSKARPYSFIFGTEPAHAPRFMFRNTLDHSKPTSLLFAFGQVYKYNAYTTHDNTDLYTWRHVAVVYNRHTWIKFYRNAKEWPIENKLPAIPELVEPKVIHTGMSRWFYGHMGLMAVFQKDLTESELGKVRNDFYI